jgi:predicted flap endonuclease-1-like 5' DNA nuclease
MTYKIIDIQGIGPEFTEKLKAAGIHTTDDLLKHTGFKALSEKTGISEKLFDKWSKMAGLMRVDGIGPQFSELLYASGVETVEQLRDRPVNDLLKKMTEVNATSNLTNALPNVMDLQKWMDNSKSLPTLEPVHVR